MVFIKQLINGKVRLYVMYGLAFFVLSTIQSCRKTTDKQPIIVKWTNKKAVSISFRPQIAATFPADSLSQLFSVHLPEQPVAILGEFSNEENDIVFTPMIPFTRGLHYQLWFRNQVIEAFDIPKADERDAPKLMAIYPSGDSLPENLLKIHLHFSNSMREGQSDKYVTLLKNERDTVKDAFLNLQPELWNPDRTILTLWLDPGRIKRDLQPNKKLGAPLQKNSHYSISVTPDWQDIIGGKLSKPSPKQFVTTLRDSLSPEPKRWKLSIPLANDNKPLSIQFGESLDVNLLEETMEILSRDNKKITGTWEIGKKESVTKFTPTDPWAKGDYKIRIETRLEDLAGNNLNRPFDRDITTNAKVGTDAFKVIHFAIKN